MASMVRLVAATSSSSEVSGGWATLTLKPSFSKILATAIQPDPSAKAPWTRTTFFVGGEVAADAPAARASPASAVANRKYLFMRISLNWCGMRQQLRECDSAERRSGCNEIVELVHPAVLVGSGIGTHLRGLPDQDLIRVRRQHRHRGLDKCIERHCTVFFEAVEQLGAYPGRRNLNDPDADVAQSVALRERIGVQCCFCGGIGGGRHQRHKA